VFSDHCVRQFKKLGELTLSPGVDARAAAGLRAQGITTLDELAGADPTQITDIPYLKGAAKKERAVLQARSLKTGNVFRLSDPDLPGGDYVHFDIESDPLAGNGAGEVYLWGFLLPPYDTDSYDYVWHDPGRAADKRRWRAFLARLETYRERFTRPVLVHYSPYERTQIRHYAARYDDHEHPIVRWLLATDGPLLDVQKSVKTAFVLPVMSYGLKSICRDRRLVDFQWELDESGSQWSVVRYHDYLAAVETGGTDEAGVIKQEILTYNEDDVRATEALVAWIQRQPG
jgi:uncharacterized protein